MSLRGCTHLNSISSCMVGGLLCYYFSVWRVPSNHKNLFNENVDYHIDLFKLLARISHLSVSLGCVGLSKAVYIKWLCWFDNPDLPRH